MQHIRHGLPCVGFGLGRLHHVFSGKERERIVLGAIDAGFAHFDLAAAYGDGLCEAEVGRLLKGRRTEISLATKFGIPCGSLGGRNIHLYFASKLFRKAFSASYGSEYSLRNFSADTAISEVEQSLKRLRTDHVDCLFFHAPRDCADLPLILETREAMERLKQQGKILQFGVSASTDYFLACGQAAMVGGVAQFELAETSASLLAQVPSEVRTSAFGLMRFLGRDARPERLDYGEVLRWFFERYPGTMPILATNRPKEIARLGKTLAAMRGTLSSEVTGDPKAGIEITNRAREPQPQSGPPSVSPARSR